jgi:NhaA family Na+:H+ antiporter
MSRRALQGINSVLDHDYSAAVSIGLGASTGLLWSDLARSSYHHVIDATWSSAFLRSANLDSLRALVINGLMTVFFFAIGAELSREIRTGSLKNPSRSMPPILGALGGMLATALLSELVGAIVNSPTLRRGWGVPMATDIAFTLGVVAIAGRHLPSEVRLFLLTLAIADDAFSVIVLAFTGAAHVRGWGLGPFALVVVLSYFLTRRTNRLGVNLLVLAALWACLVWANVEPPLAGVVAGLFVSFKTPSSITLEDVTNRISNGAVLPLFALVACGVRWQDLSFDRATFVVIFGLVAIRIVGKVIGIMGGVAFARALKWRLESSITWRVLAGVSVLCAIGFTVPLLFANALFGSRSPAYGADTLGLLLASVIAAIVGVTYLRWLGRSGQRS